MIEVGEKELQFARVASRSFERQRSNGVGVAELDPRLLAIRERLDSAGVYRALGMQGIALTWRTYQEAYMFPVRPTQRGENGQR